MRLFLLLLPIIITACAPTDAVTRRHTQGQSPEYQEAFKAGCGTGYVAAGHPYSKFSKDSEAYSNSDQYKQGWDDGFQVCKSKYQSIRD